MKGLMFRVLALVCFSGCVFFFFTDRDSSSTPITKLTPCSKISDYEVEEKVTIFLQAFDKTYPDYEKEKNVRKPGELILSCQMSSELAKALAIHRLVGNKKSGRPYGKDDLPGLTGKYFSETFTLALYTSDEHKFVGLIICNPYIDRLKIDFEFAKNLSFVELPPYLIGKGTALFQFIRREESAPLKFDCFFEPSAAAQSGE